jgi:hypothetical protein
LYLRRYSPECRVISCFESILEYSIPFEVPGSFWSIQIGCLASVIFISMINGTIDVEMCGDVGVIFQACEQITIG